VVVIVPSVISNLVLSYREGKMRDLVVESVNTKTNERFLTPVRNDGSAISADWFAHFDTLSANGL